mgnify:CR=1 FL=1
MLKRRVETRLVTLLGLVLVALVLGGYVGNHLAWGSKTLTVAKGRVHLLNADTGLISFASHDAPTMTVSGSISWTAASGEGDGRPPCLRLGQSIEAEIGYTWVREPGGGRHPVIAWMRCP